MTVGQCRQHDPLKLHVQSAIIAILCSTLISILLHFRENSCLKVACYAILANLYCQFLLILFSNYITKLLCMTLNQGWATFLVGGPNV